MLQNLNKFVKLDSENG